jgi:thymidine kinase
MYKNWYFIVGPMFSGKTTELLNLAKRMKHKKYVVIKHIIDTRSERNQIVSHDGTYSECIDCATDEEIGRAISNHDMILIDEVQFFPLEDLLKKIDREKKVYLAGLDRDFRGGLFQTSKWLLQNIPGKNIYRKRAICKCGNFADYTKLMAETQINGSILVGGSEKYNACCSSCFSK